jgi:proteasome lid subunit RPN8/RPN11
MISWGAEASGSSMKLLINESDLRCFKRHAARGYPREVYGILLGKPLANQTFKIAEIAIPPVVEATYDYVIPDYDKIAEIVAASDYDYVGSIHSHPQAPPTISSHDYRHWDNDRVVGILSVRKRNIYKVTELKFWRRNTALPVAFKTFKPGHNGQSRSG